MFDIDLLVKTFDSGITSFLSTPASVIAVLIGAAGVSVLTELVKKLGKLENDKVVTAVFMTVSALASGLDYLLTSSDLPPSILGVSTFLLIGVATPVYRYGIKPLSIVIAKYRSYKVELANKVSEIEAVNKTNSIEKSVLTEVTETNGVDTIETAINTPVSVSAPKVLVAEQKPNTADF